MPSYQNIKELVGVKYGRLTIMSDYVSSSKQRKVVCVCECGKEGVFYLSNIKKGHSKSCGCLKIDFGKSTATHNLSKHPIYRCWTNMLDRCYSDNYIGSENYKERGVIVCEEWRNNFPNFYNWAISNGWQKGLQLDKDKLSPFKVGNIYSPEFCCFLTRKENMKYRSYSRIIEYNNSSKSLAEWSEILGFEFQLLAWRLRKGWAVEKAFETPVMMNYSRNQKLKT